MELYLNSEFYSMHPSFIWSISRHSNVFISIDAILAISVSHNALNSNKTKGELVQNEAVNICTFFYLGWVFMCPWSCISLFKFRSLLLQKYWVNIKVQTNVQSIDWNSLIQSFWHWKGSLVLLHICSYLFICSFVLLWALNTKNKGNRKQKLSPHSTSHSKSCGQSSVKAFLNKSLLKTKVSWIWILLKAVLLWDLSVIVQLWKI